MRAEALRLLDRAAPSDPEACYRAGLAALRCDLAEQGIPILAAAVRAHPREARLWQVLGLAYRRLEEHEPAISAFARAAELDPANPLIAHSLARVALEAGLPATALFARAVALAPDDLSVALGQAAARFAEGHASAAIDGLDQRLGLQPGWLEGHATAARLRWMCGERDGFTVSLERALTAAPRIAPLWQQLVAIHMEGKLYDRALEALARARRSAGPRPEFDAAEAVCRSELGELEDADRMFERLGAPVDAAAAASRARHLLRAGRPEEAVRLAEAWRGRDPGHLLWPYLALAWRLTGDPRWRWLEGDPSFVGVYDIGDRVGSLDALASTLRGLHHAVQQPLEQSLRGGTQTDGPLFARIEPEIRALRRAVLATIEEHVAGLPPVDPDHPLLSPRRAPIRFSGAWSVRLTDGGYHAEHVHPQGWLSSAFYVACPEDSIGDGDGDHSGWLALGEARELGLDLPPIEMVRPRPGRLVLFPSTLWHGTRSFPAGERLTVAFDVARTHD